MIVTALEPTTAIPNHVTHRNISSRPQNIMENSRIVFLDYLRVIACLMVIIVHCVEPFYLGGEGTLIQNWNDGFWCTVIDSALRAAVPLFVMASSYLQFPVKYDTLTFFKVGTRRHSLCNLLAALYPHSTIRYRGLSTDAQRTACFAQFCRFGRPPLVHIHAVGALPVDADALPLDRKNF